MMDILIFNVNLGQCIFCCPRNDLSYGLMIDCGNTNNFQPVDMLISNNLLSHDGTTYLLRNLTLTNYDEDHFSGLPYLLSKAKIQTVGFPKNLSPSEIRASKAYETEALRSVIGIRETYIYNATSYNPPFTKRTFYLNKEDFGTHSYATNDLSQLVFVEYCNSVLCVPGDLEEYSWQLLLAKQDVRDWLQKVDIFVASHHGRFNGYCGDVFAYCGPQCIVISDNQIIHETQENMAGLYGRHVTGYGIALNGNYANPRRVLTTRSDGHIHIRVETNGRHTYVTL